MSEKGFVYLLSASGSGLHKIGHTGDIEKRIAKLQTGSSGELTLVKSWPGSRDDEKALHHKLDAYRQSGEWFRFPKCVLHELSLMDEFNIEAIRLPDYTNPWQVDPIKNIVTAVGEVIEIAAGASIVEMAERLKAHLDPFYWAPMVDIDPEPIDKMIGEFEAYPLDKRTQKRVVRMRNSFKAFLHWKSIEAREQARGGTTMRQWMHQFMQDLYAKQEKRLRDILKARNIS